MFKTSIVYEANYNAIEDVIINQGGSGSSKTYSIIQALFTFAVQESEVITVVGSSIPNLKAGALRDALDIYNNSQNLKDLVTDYNKTDRVFLFHNGSILEFKSYLTPQEAKSGKRDRLFVNEAQGITFEIYMELYLRTRKKTYIDYNPNEEFWVHEKLIGTPNTKLFISDHRHNPFLAQKVRDKLEALRFQDMELFKVYARGMTGKIEGLIFRNYEFIDEIPKEAKLIAHWLDWGFTNDPSSFGSVYKHNGELCLDERIYETGLTNSDIIAKLKAIGIPTNQEIIADSSEPKSIEDLKRAGFYVTGAHKGPDSIIHSIDKLKPFKLNITRRSIGLSKEIKSYKWAVDSSGKTINKPIDFMNHSIDGVRYVALNKIGKEVGPFDYSFGGV